MPIPVANHWSAKTTTNLSTDSNIESKINAEESRSIRLRWKGRCWAIAWVLVISPGSEHHKISQHQSSGNDHGSNLFNFLNPHAAPLRL